MTNKHHYRMTAANYEQLKNASFVRFLT